MSLELSEEPRTEFAETSKDRALTWRSVVLGTITVIAICALTPINDFTLSNTSLAAGFMPLAGVLTLFVFVVLINAPLHRFVPRFALSSAELAVIVLMSFVACALSNWGLMRFFIPTPVSPFHLGATDETFWKSFTGMDLPAWLFPVQDAKTGRTSEIARWFYTHVPEGETIPFRAWIRPLLAWGVFLLAMLATLAAIARLTFEQWAQNERLPFPLVQVQSALLQPPPKGRALNDIFRSNVFWIGLAIAFVAQGLSCLNTYFPKNVPKIPLSYDFTGILSEPPLFYLNTKLKKAALSFTVVGVTFFIRSRVAFSLWISFIIVNLVEVQYSMRQGEMPGAAWQDQHLGACVAFIGAIAWIGRHYWIRVIKSAVGAGKDRSAAIAMWIAVVGVIVMIGWLRVVGVQLWIAMLIVAFILMAHLVVARVVAETGLPFYRSGIAVAQIESLMPVKWFGLRDIFFSCIYTVLGPITSRDSLTTFTQQGLGIYDKAAGTPAKKGRSGLGLVIAWSIILGFAVAAFSTLYCQYSYPTPVAADQVPARNYFGAEYIPKREVANPLDDFSRGRFTPKQHNSYVHLSIGFAVTCGLEAAAMYWSGWPLLPVGYVASYGAFIGNAWFSIFIGWLAQLVVVRLGGASLFQKSRPFFIGLIFGEGLVAGLWLIVNAIIVLNGGESQAVKFLL